MFANLSLVTCLRRAKPRGRRLVAGIDVAHIVATRRLSEGDLANARIAAETGCLAAHSDDKPKLDLAEVMRQEGHTDAAEEYVHKQIANHSDDHDAPSTYRLAPLAS